ncbi:glucosaminidase domain-containing protein [Bacillus sp. BRMEA1]|uniref:glucosaminidase domain-containing protein n=1 Tax=Neobacillus endophyticus TaxID=2738405 RepID=UPI0015651F64|nr:glucosaminidase domain-containing protein [Neobacillus endophyticus]NRD79403.1 glucosaminidase domain-containing protein [Neobacillus endophyticus]
MKIGDNSLARTMQAQLNPVSQNQNLPSQASGSSQFGSVLAAVLNQLLLQTENDSLASDPSNMNSTADNGLGNMLSSNNTGMDSLISALGLNSGGVSSLLGNISSYGNIADSLTGNSSDDSSSTDSLIGTSPLNTNDALLGNLSLNNNQPLNFHSINADQLNSQLDGKLTGMGQVFIQAGKLYNVDPALLAAITKHESANGKSNAAYEKNNVAGVMGSDGLKSYSSVEACIMDTARNLSKNYLGAGLSSIAEIGHKYAPVGAGNDPTGLNNYWVNGVTKFYNQLRA